MVSALPLCVLVIALGVVSSQVDPESIDQSEVAERRTFKHGKPIKYIPLIKKHKKFAGWLPHGVRTEYAEVPIVHEAPAKPIYKFHRYQGIEVKPVTEYPETIVESHPVEHSSDFEHFGSDVSFSASASPVFFHDKPAFQPISGGLLPPPVFSPPPVFAPAPQPILTFVPVRQQIPITIPKPAPPIVSIPQPAPPIFVSIPAPLPQFSVPASAPLPQIPLPAPAPLPQIPLPAPAPLPQIHLPSPTPLPHIPSHAPAPLPQISLPAPAPLPQIHLPSPTPLPHIPSHLPAPQLTFPSSPPLPVKIPAPAFPTLPSPPVLAPLPVFSTPAPVLPISATPEPEFPYPPSGTPIHSYIKDISVPEHAITEATPVKVVTTSYDEAPDHIKTDTTFLEKLKGWKADKASAALSHLSFLKPNPVSTIGHNIHFSTPLKPLPLTPDYQPPALFVPSAQYLPPVKYESFPPNNIEPPPLVNSYGVPIPHDTYATPVHVSHDRLSPDASEEEPSILPPPTTFQQDRTQKSEAPTSHNQDQPIFQDVSKVEKVAPIVETATVESSQPTEKAQEEEEETNTASSN